MRDNDTKILEEAYEKTKKYVVVDPTGNGVEGCEYGAYNLDGTGQWEWENSDRYNESWETNFHIFPSREEALIWAQKKLKPVNRKYMILPYGEWGKMLEQKMRSLKREIRSQKTF